MLLGWDVNALAVSNCMSGAQGIVHSIDDRMRVVKDFVILYLPHIYLFFDLVIISFPGRLLNVSVPTKNLNSIFNWLYLDNFGLYFRISQILCFY
jgi:hypothetical protein